MESDAKNVSGLDQFNPQIRVTYRQYLFDGKKNQIKNIVKHLPGITLYKPQNQKECDATISLILESKNN